MDMDRIKRQGWLAWGFLGLLAVSCAALAVLQYRWIGEVSVAERERLSEALQTNLGRLSREFNRDLSTAVAALMADPDDDDEAVAESFAARFRQWRESSPHPKLIKRVGLVVMEKDKLGLSVMDAATGEMKAADWPAEWASRRDRFVARMAGESFGGLGRPDEDPLVLEFPRLGRFRGGPGGGPGGPPPDAPREGPRPPREWMIVEFDAATIQKQILAELVRHHLGADSYDVAVMFNDAPVFPGTKALKTSDASVRLFELDLGEMMRRLGRNGRGPGPGFGRAGNKTGNKKGGGPAAAGFGFGFGPGGPNGPNGGGPPQGRGRWEMFVRHQAGSLDAIVEKARWRNLGVSSVIFLLMLATAGALVRVSRRSQQLAELQMNFVAGVSHELRTPLTVIRTAGHNLQGKMAQRPEHVERYGKLIQDESEKLTALVEQVLRFASVRAGHVLREKEPAHVDELIEAGIRSSRAALDKGRLEIERKIEPGLPVVLADGLALKHVFQNLLDNAIKYGTESSNWIGLEASRQEDNIVVTVADRGPGIPPDELTQVFEPFFRGRRAIQDQVHGTGLGLNLVKEIVVAHNGTIDVESTPGQGTRFIVKLPVAPPEYQDEFAHTAG